MMLLDVGLFGFTFLGTLCASCTWVCFPLYFWKIFSHNFFKYIFDLLSLLLLEPLG